jgi:tetratricopeptide (TPR) repeat protein
MANQHLGFT